MRKLLIILTILLTVDAISQIRLYSIFGRVVDRQDTSKQISCLKVRLSFNDSLHIGTDCDERGYYNIQFSKQLLKQRTLRIVPFQDLKQIDKLFPTPNDCPYSYNSSEKYMGISSVTVEIVDSVLNYRADFKLTPIISDPIMPCINFSKNTTDFVNCHDDELSGETWLNCLKYILQKEPGTIIELIGHSWLEKDPHNLGLRRANVVKQKLVSRGIDSLRMVTISKGDEQPLYDSKFIRKAKTKSEMEHFTTQNRRVVFKVLSFEYDPKSQKSGLNNSRLKIADYE